MSSEEEPYCCGYCAWAYDPVRGYARYGVEPGTPFGQLPEEFMCPECGAKLKWFEPCRQEDLCAV
jgi:rubredoxin